MDILKNLIPLLQSLLWILFILFLIFYFRKDLQFLINVLRNQIESGVLLTKAGPLEFAERIEAMESKIQLAKKVEDAFLLQMGDAMYKNLKKIASGNFGHYKIHKSSGLERELYYLRDIGYIAVDSIGNLPKKGANLSDIEADSISNLPEEGANLSDYVKITTTGKHFVNLRESYLSST